MDKIILASSSPRRIELLKSAYIDFDVEDHNFDEKSLDLMKPHKYVESMSFRKANSLDMSKYGSSYILGADTVVSYKDKILGKPASVEEAYENVMMLSGKKHEVLTGLTLLNRSKGVIISDSSITVVKFRTIDKDFIRFYLDNKHFQGYAGGYAIQGIFSLIVEYIVGSYSNVVGLPMELLYKLFLKADIHPYR